MTVTAASGPPAPGDSLAVTGRPGYRDRVSDVTAGISDSDSDSDGDGRRKPAGIISLAGRPGSERVSARLSLAAAGGRSLPGRSGRPQSSAAAVTRWLSHAG